MEVGELMTRKVFSCAPADSLSQAARLMWDHDVGCVPVVDDQGRALAMVTDRDVLHGQLPYRQATCGPFCWKRDVEKPRALQGNGRRRDG